MNKNFNFKYLIKSSLAIFILAAIIHSLYDITKFELLKPFTPINESVWEHLKMMFYAQLLYGLIEYFSGFKTFKNFFVARNLTAIITTTLVPLLYY